MSTAPDGSPTTQLDAFVDTEADAYFRRNPEHPAESHGFDPHIAERLPDRPTILEVGCADGRRLLRLEQLRPGGRYVGVDPSPSAVEHGNATWPQLDLRVGSAEALPVAEQFDAVVLGFFLYVCDRALLPRIVSEADRAVRDGGVLAIIDFAAPYPSRRPYHHVPGLHTYRMRYENLFLAYPSYSVVHRTVSAMPGGTRTDGSDAAVLTILSKHLDHGYAVEP